MNESHCSSCKDKQDHHKKRSNKLYDKNVRDKKATSFYKSKQWRTTRVQALIRDHYLCVRCLDNKRIKKADMVDHIIPIKQDWSLRLSLNNLQSLCNPCHAAKTAEDERKYR